MTNKKISALTAATTPLAGTEVLPIVQSSATTQVSIANLTAGRAVSALSLTTTGAITGGNNVSAANAFEARGTPASFYTTGGMAVYTDTAGIGYLKTYANSSGTGGVAINFRISNTNEMTLYSGGNLNLNTGNLVQGTVAKGINFTANTPAAGMTSQLLNWYEEGTWTPNQGAGLTLVGAFSSTGKYTRVGRNVTVSGTVTGATSVAVTAASVITTNLPFTIGTAGHGNATNAANTAFAAIICNTGTTVTSAGGIAATGTITFSATYFV